MNNRTRFAEGRSLDVIALGRLGQDFYAQQIGARLEDVASFAKYLGGSSANTAFGCARLGLKAALISRVGNDAMGRFLVETLQKEGCDTSHVGVDPRRLTAGVVLGIKDRNTFPLVFLREDCADMAIPEDDIDEAFIATSRALLITGTHFSQPHVHRISTLALERARSNNVRTVLDIDYRPVLWGLTNRGDGETRFIASDAVTAHLQKILPLFDLVIGTEEEFAIAGGSTDIIVALEGVRRVTAATLVVKRGPMGCAVIDGPLAALSAGEPMGNARVPSSLDDAFNGQGVEVEVLNVLGAGDAFSAGFLSGWVRSEDYVACTRYANACGALVVSRHGCAPAMPTRVELDYYIANASHIPRPDRDAQLARLHRVTAPRPSGPRGEVFAMDGDMRSLEAMAREMGADTSALTALSRLVVDALGGLDGHDGHDGRDRSSGLADSLPSIAPASRIGLLCDDRHGQDALNAATGRGWWVARPIELPRSNPLEFEHGRSVGTTLNAWPVEQVVRCRVLFHPDDAVDRRLENEAQLRSLYDAVQVSGHELAIELAAIDDDMPRDDDTITRSIKRLYNIGIHPEWWIVDSGALATSWAAIDALIDARDPFCRGVLMRTKSSTFTAPSKSRYCRGFVADVTMFNDAIAAWLRAGAVPPSAGGRSGEGGNRDRHDSRDKAFVNEMTRSYRAAIDTWPRAS